MVGRLDEVSSKTALEQTLDKLDMSNVFVSFFTPGYLDNPRCKTLLEYALAKDMPICLLVVRGAMVPPWLIEKVATIEYVDLSDKVMMTAALGRIKALADKIKAKQGERPPADPFGD